MARPSPISAATAVSRVSADEVVVVGLGTGAAFLGVALLVVGLTVGALDFDVGAVAFVALFLPAVLSYPRTR